MFHQMSLALGVFDVIISSSLIINKDVQSLAICSVQEYMLQFGLLGKASVTVTICYVSMRTIRDLEPQSTRFVFSLLGALLSGVLLCLGLSIYFDSAGMFCGDSEYSVFTSFTKNTREVVYIATVVLPICCCIAINCFCFFVIMSKIKNQERLISVCSDVTALNALRSDEAKLYKAVKNLIFYPIVLALCFMPSVAVVVHHLITGKSSKTMYAIAAVLLGLNGTIMAINYFRQQKLHPNLQKISFGLRNHPVFNLGRNISSFWASSANESRFQSSDTRNPVHPSSGMEASSGITLTDSSYYPYADSSSNSRSDSRSNSRSTSRNDASAAMRKLQLQLPSLLESDGFDSDDRRYPVF